MQRNENHLVQYSLPLRRYASGSLRTSIFERESVRGRYAKRSRQKVILDSMESFSVENLQALVIIALDTVRTHIFSSEEKILILRSRLIVVEDHQHGP
jgi:hypothetical protein